jgi:predicted helicase
MGLLDAYLLHSPDYRERFAYHLGKELPRIPRVKTAADFWAFFQAGRKLAGLYLNYESVGLYPLVIDSAGKKLVDADFRVEKMRFGKKGKDLTTLYYNDKTTLTAIPLEAYDYVVNGKPALDWVVERQGAKASRLTRTAASLTTPMTGRSRPWGTHATRWNRFSPWSRSASRPSA